MEWIEHIGVGPPEFFWAYGERRDERYRAFGVETHIDGFRGLPPNEITDIATSVSDVIVNVGYDKGQGQGEAEAVVIHVALQQDPQKQSSGATPETAALLRISKGDDDERKWLKDLVAPHLQTIILNAQDETKKRNKGWRGQGRPA
ncbi:unnamed protein product [Amoebophrya sp. A25]|nr:unnamed protein product [Amoebophrya sp. A25]|eukprot:GSA25T00008237001.1